jgi:hypothetical protein
MKLFIMLLSPISCHSISPQHPVLNIKKKSSHTAIQSFLDDIIGAMDSKRCALGQFIDPTKAFDVINHDLLLVKLERYGIGYDS